MAKPFDPDEYLKQKPAPDAGTAAFDPDAYLGAAAPPPPGPAAPVLGGSDWDASTGAGAGVRGFGQGSSLGFADEIGGAAAAAAVPLTRVAEEAGKTMPGRAVLRLIYPWAKTMPDAQLDAVMSRMSTESRQMVLGGDGVGDAYRGQRDFLRSEDKRSEKAKPAQFYGGMLAGGIAAPGPKAVGPLYKSARELAHFVPGAVTGAAGAIGASEREYLPADKAFSGRDLVVNAAKDAAPGAVLGGTAATVAGIGLEKGVPLATRLLKRGAEEATLRAMGVRAGISNVLKKMDKSADDARQMARVALEEKLIPLFGGAETISKRTQERLPQVAALSEGILQDANAAAADRINRAAAVGGYPANLSSPFRLDKMAQEASRKYHYDQVNPTTGLADPAGLTSIERAGTPRAQKLIDEVESEMWADIPSGPKAGQTNPDYVPPPQRTFMRANKLKQAAQRGIDYKASTALQTLAERRVASGMRKSIEDQAGEALGDLSMAETLRLNNRKLGELIDIDTLARDEAERQLGRKPLGGVATAAGALIAGGSVGGATQSPILGGLSTAAVIGSKLSAPYVNAFTARTMDAGRGFSKWFEPIARKWAPNAGKSAAGLAGEAWGRRAPKDPDERERASVSAFQSSGL